MSINVLVNILNTCFLKKNLRGGLECTCILDIFKTCVANHCQGVGVRGGLQASKLKPRVLAAVAAVMSQLLS